LCTEVAEVKGTKKTSIAPQEREEESEIEGRGETKRRKEV